jgi:hypothetical protein
MTTTEGPCWDVVVQRSGGGWSLTIEGVVGVSGLQVVDLAAVEPKARKLIGDLTDADPSTFGVDVDIRLPTDIQLRLARAESLCSEAVEEAESVIVILREAGLSIRDISRILRCRRHRPPRSLTVTNAEIARHGLARHPEAVGVQWDDAERFAVSTCRSCLEALRGAFVDLPPEEENVLVYEARFMCDRCPNVDRPEHDDTEAR